MLRIVTGSFHLVLEHALVEDIRSSKTDDPFAPLAVIVPSASLVEHLKLVLTRVEPHSYLNIHFLTFHQLTLRLRDDLESIRGTIPGSALQLADDFFFEHMVRQVVRHTLPGLEPLTRLPASPGTWKALWSTVRDLKDAVVDSTTALNALEEGLFEEEDRTWLRALFTLHAAVVGASGSLGVGSPDDVSFSLGRNVSDSKFLRSLQRVFYYGFYDLSQVQLSFFESVMRVAPATLYFPLEDRPAFDFARQFFERHLLPLADDHESRSEGSIRIAARESVELSVTNVIGSEEELSTVCREILTLTEENGYGFDEIGVVARSLESYQPRLQSVFDQHLVPFTSTAVQPLSREPLVKTLLRLASLRLDDFDRAAMLDVVTSPFYLAEAAGAARANLRPGVWRSLIYTLGITKGEVEWRRLAEPATSSILRGVEVLEDDRPQAGSYETVQLTFLWEIVWRLIQDCRALPAEGSVGTLTDAFLSLVRSHIHVPGLFDETPDELPESTDLSKVGLLIRSGLVRLQMLDRLGGDYSWEEWVELFRRVIEETCIPIEPDEHQGVHVLDAMSARGRTFRALFVLGMNEKLFPRFVREDPFLRDRHRVVLDSTLGYKIDEKLAGHEEEVLLFELISRAATKRLYLSYQRGDETGRVMAPSGFVGLAMRDPRFVVKPEETVPRRLTQRISDQPSIQERLPAVELALGCLLHGHDARPVLDAMGRDRPIFEQGQVALKILERESPELGPFDGMVGAPAPSVPPTEERSISPTSLERYATCPFQYFAEKVLRLQPVRRLHNDPLPPLRLGIIVHESLRLSYERLILLCWPESALTESTVQSLVNGAVSEMFALHAASEGTGHALLWTLAREQVTKLAVAAVSADQAEYQETGFRPIAFEAAAEGIVPLEADSPTSCLKVHGTLDRVDYRAEPPGLRIVDYKFKQGNEMTAVDRNLVLSAVRGFRLQAPLYARMSLPGLPEPTDVQLLFLAPQWKQPISRSTFDAGLWTGHTGNMITQTLVTLVQGITNRDFFILPDGYCDYCEYSGSCRRHDSLAWWRSYRSPQARVLRRLRKQKVSDE